MDRTSFNQTLDLVQEALGERYLVTGPLAQGGMSILLRGRQTLLDQPVAIKVMHAQAVGNRSLRDRFVREARILASLQAPQVSRVYDAGTLKDGRLYLVMELLQGENLEVISERGPLSLGLAARLLMQVCDGLIAAHDKGIIHRDLKPENVFIVPDASGQMCAKLIDFGIAKDTSDQQEVTGTYTIVGSPLYVPPEQIASSRTVDKRADIWAMGIMLYQLVLQRHPFEDPSLALLLNKIQNEPLPPFPADSDPMFEIIVERCLAKKPEDRYPTANELKEALSSLADQERPDDDDEDMPTLGPRPAPLPTRPTERPPPAASARAVVAPRGAPPAKAIAPAAKASAHAPPRPTSPQHLADARQEPESGLVGADSQPISSTEDTLMQPVPDAHAAALPAPIAAKSRPLPPTDAPKINVASTLPSPGQPSLARPRPAPPAPAPPPTTAPLPAKPPPPAPSRPALASQAPPAPAHQNVGTPPPPPVRASSVPAPQPPQAPPYAQGPGQAPHSSQGQLGPFSHGAPQAPPRASHQTIPLVHIPNSGRSSRGHTIPLMPGAGGPPRSAPVFAEPLPAARTQVPTVLVERRPSIWPFVALGVGIVLVLASVVFAVMR